MVVAWLGLYFVSAKRSKVRLVVPNLAQEHHVHHMDPYTNCIGHTRSHIQSHLHYLTSRVLHNASLSIIEVMRIDRAYYRVSYQSYQVSMVSPMTLVAKNSLV